MDGKGVTVIIPTRNRAGLLKRAIRSVQRQTYENVRIAVYDNASTDGTSTLVRELARTDPRVFYHRHESDIGGAENFLYGLRQVSSPFFCLLSDDDVIFPGFLEEAITWLERFPEARFAAGGTLEVTHDGRLVFAPQAYWPRDGCFVPPHGLDLMLAGFHPSWTTIVFRQAVLKEVGEFTKSLGILADVDYILRVACCYPYVVFRKPSGIFTRQERSFSESADVSIGQEYEEMLAGLLSNPAIPEEAKLLIRARLPVQRRKHLLKVAIKQLLRMEPGRSLETVAAFEERYRPSVPSTVIRMAAVLGMRCPVLLRALRYVDALRFTLRSLISRIYARLNGAGGIDLREYRTFLRE